MRLGAQPCALQDDSRAARCYEARVVRERHRHRYELNPEYQRQFEERGLAITGMNPEQRLAEIIEIPAHPWFVAVQFHPEFKSKPHQPHPLFVGFVEAALDHHQSRVQATV
jgi:CTP synthase